MCVKACLVSAWCSGYHVCFTRRRSLVQSRPLISFAIFRNILANLFQFDPKPSPPPHTHQNPSTPNALSHDHTRSTAHLLRYDTSNFTVTAQHKPHHFKHYFPWFLPLHSTKRTETTRRDHLPFENTLRHMLSSHRVRHMLVTHKATFAFHTHITTRAVRTIVATPAVITHITAHAVITITTIPAVETQTTTPAVVNDRSDTCFRNDHNNTHCRNTHNDT